MVDKEPTTSKTYIEADWRCRRERFYRTEFEGWGLEPTTLNEDLEIGKRIHKGLESFFGPGRELGAVDTAKTRLDSALHALYSLPTFTEPWQTWIEASLIAWATRVWPRLEKEYEIVLVEPRLKFHHNGVLYKVGPDLVLRSRLDKSYWVYDFKSFRWWDNKKWLRAIQLQLGAMAVEVELSLIDHVVEVAGSIIQGISKGTTRGDKLYHPLVYGYRREGEPGVTKAAYSWEYKKGFERFDVTLYPGGVRAWVAEAPDSVIADCFPQTPPIYLNRPKMREFLDQRSQRELNIAHATSVLEDAPADHAAAVLRDEFEQNFSACESDRFKCPFFEACHIEAVGKDPVGSGLFVKREAR